MKSPPARFLAAALAIAASAFAAAPRPNVLLICVDDLKPLLGCYGDKTVQSPNLDRLAARGVRFDAAYCNQAVCSPSRNALMSGLRSTTLGIYDLPTNFRVAVPDAVTLPQYFRSHGYRAESMGKIMHPGHGNHEDAASWSVPHWTSGAPAFVTPEAISIQKNRPASASGGGVAQGEPGAANYRPAAAHGPVVESAEVPDNTYRDGQVADEAIRRLRSAKERPSESLFLAVGFIRPHLPFVAPKKYWDLYDRAKFSLAPFQEAPAGAPAYAATGWGELRAYAGMPAAGPLTAAQQRELLHGYHAAISYMDAQAGRVLDELDRLGLASNTIVVLWGDHGWHLGDHGQWCKHTNYEQAVRIPIIVAAPGTAQPGRGSRALVESVDLFPTLADLAGLPAPRVPQGLDGRSFAAVLRDPAAATKPAVFHAYPRTHPQHGAIIGRAVRTDRHRLVEWKKPGAAPATAELELYDYTTDPLERKNLAAEQPDVIDRLRALLAAQPEARPQIANPVAAQPTEKKKKKAAAK